MSLRVADDRHDESAVGLRREAEVDARRAARSPRRSVSSRAFSSGNLAQPGHDEPGDEASRPCPRPGRGASDRVLARSHSAVASTSTQTVASGISRAAAGRACRRRPGGRPCSGMRSPCRRPRTDADGRGVAAARGPRSSRRLRRRRRSGAGLDDAMAASTSRGAGSVRRARSRERRRSTPCSRARRRTSGEMTWTARAVHVAGSTGVGAWRDAAAGAGGAAPTPPAAARRPSAVP